MPEQSNPYAPPDATLGGAADPRASAPPSIGRQILGVLVGGIGVDLILGLTVSAFVTVLVAIAFGENETVLIGTATVVGLSFSILGGYIAAYIAPWRPVLMGALSGLVSALCSLPIVLLTETAPIGPFDIAGTVVHFPLAAWGGYLARNARA